jgi:hypothetical protein
MAEQQSVRMRITEALERFGFAYDINPTMPNGKQASFRIVFPGELGPVYVIALERSDIGTSANLWQADNVIVIQGQQAAKLFQGLINCLGILRSLGH